VEARAYTKGLISRLLKGELPTSTAAIAFQGINALMRVVEMERKIYEQDELEQRIDSLERRQRAEQATFQTRHRRR
jgi:translation elongation factor EF-1beta